MPSSELNLPLGAPPKTNPFKASMLNFPKPPKDMALTDFSIKVEILHATGPALLISKLGLPSNTAAGQSPRQGLWQQIRSPKV